jgi:hypothetical protein
MSSNPWPTSPLIFKHPITGRTFAEHWQDFKGDRTLEPLG